MGDETVPWAGCFIVGGIGLFFLGWMATQLLVALTPYIVPFMVFLLILLALGALVAAVRWGGLFLLAVTGNGSPNRRSLALSGVSPTTVVDIPADRQDHHAVQDTTRTPESPRLLPTAINPGNAPASPPPPAPTLPPTNTPEDLMRQGMAIYQQLESQAIANPGEQFFWWFRDAAGLRKLSPEQYKLLQNNFLAIMSDVSRQQFVLALRAQEAQLALSDERARNDEQLRMERERREGTIQLAEELARIEKEKQIAITEAEAKARMPEVRARLTAAENRELYRSLVALADTPEMAAQLRKVDRVVQTLEASGEEFDPETRQTIVGAMLRQALFQQLNLKDEPLKEQA